MSLAYTEYKLNLVPRRLSISLKQFRTYSISLTQIAHTEYELNSVLLILSMRIIFLDN